MRCLIRIALQAKVQLTHLMTLKIPFPVLSLHYLQSYLRPEAVHCHDDKHYKIDDDDDVEEEDSAQDNEDKKNSFFRHSRKGAGDTDALGDNCVQHNSDDDSLVQWCWQKYQLLLRSILQCWKQTNSVSPDDDSVDDRKDSVDDHREVGVQTSYEDGADNVHQGDQVDILVVSSHLQPCHSYYWLMIALPRTSRPRRQGLHGNSVQLSSSF